MAGYITPSQLPAPSSSGVHLIHWKWGHHALRTQLVPTTWYVKSRPHPKSTHALSEDMTPHSSTQLAQAPTALASAPEPFLHPSVFRPRKPSDATHSPIAPGLTSYETRPTHVDLLLSIASPAGAAYAEMRTLLLPAKLGYTYHRVAQSGLDPYLGPAFVSDGSNVPGRTLLS
ncbi:hypothetical protein BKA56DRAFT_651136 [Ilyonectria sp. MPI-CAGE-AT-0026]|nr:hypothetical protein BKA56DRAFT_651136 [Ilyonectria sp. MPI-CAGE-AT-0026]